MRWLRYGYSMWNERDVELLIARVKKISPHADRRWGKMTLAGMLAHCALALEVYMNDFELPDNVHWYAPITRWHALSFIPFPRGVKLPVELPSEEGLDFEEEKSRLIKAIGAFSRTPEDHSFPPHFMLGPLDRPGYGILAYKHTDHHLRQFGA